MYVRPAAKREGKEGTPVSTNFLDVAKVYWQTSTINDLVVGRILYDFEGGTVRHDLAKAKDDRLMNSVRKRLNCPCVKSGNRRLSSGKYFKGEKRDAMLSHTVTITYSVVICQSRNPCNKWTIDP